MTIHYKANILKDRLFFSLNLSVIKKPLVHNGVIENSWLLCNKGKDVFEYKQLHAPSFIKEVDILKDFKVLVLPFEKCYAYFLVNKAK